MRKDYIHEKRTRYPKKGKVSQQNRVLGNMIREKRKLQRVKEIFQNGEQKEMKKIEYQSRRVRIGISKEIQKGKKWRRGGVAPENFLQTEDEFQSQKTQCMPITMKEISSKTDSGHRSLKPAREKEQHIQKRLGNKMALDFSTETRKQWSKPSKLRKKIFPTQNSIPSKTIN